MRTSLGHTPIQVIPVVAGGWQQAISGPKQPPCSLCLPLGRCHLGQASQRLDDAKPIVHPLQVLPEIESLLVERLRLLLTAVLMQPHIPDVDQEHPEPASIL